MFWCLLAPGTWSAACDSSNAVPQPVDAPLAPVDAPLAPDASTICTCPGTELLSRQHLIDVWRLELSFNGSRSRFTFCPLETDVPISGACLFSDLGEPSFLTGFGRQDDSLGLSWACYTTPYSFGGLDVATRCVRPLDRTGEIAEGCTCPPIETPVNRIFLVRQAVSIPEGEIATVAPSCPAGSALLGGSCNVGYVSTLLGEGPYPDDPQTWKCSWYAVNGTEEGQASAICLNAPGPDAVTGEPVAPEVIEHVFAEDVIPANGTRIVNATCAPGDTLIAGGCQVVDVSPDIVDMGLKRIGLTKPEDNRPNTWQCSWRNPTAIAPKVLAMATCVKPPATASDD